MLAASRSPPGPSAEPSGSSGVPTPSTKSNSESFNVTMELAGRGYTEDQIRALWGGNTLRIMREAEEVAREMQGG